MPVNFYKYSPLYFENRSVGSFYSLTQNSPRAPRFWGAYQFRTALEVSRPSRQTNAEEENAIDGFSSLRRSFLLRRGRKTDGRRKDCLRKAGKRPYGRARKTDGKGGKRFFSFFLKNPEIIVDKFPKFMYYIQAFNEKGWYIRRGVEQLGSSSGS